MIIAFDLETTGLDPQQDQILQIGAVNVADPDQTFMRYVKHDRYSGNAYALAMNSDILYKCNSDESVWELTAVRDLTAWLAKQNPNNEKLVPLGFNVGSFDIAFLNELCRRMLFRSPFHHGAIELGSYLMRHFDSVQRITSKSALDHFLNKEVAHDALQDAKDAAEIFTYVSEQD